MTHPPSITTCDPTVQKRQIRSGLARRKWGKLEKTLTKPCCVHGHVLHFAPRSPLGGRARPPLHLGRPILRPPAFSAVSCPRPWRRVCVAFLFAVRSADTRAAAAGDAHLLRVINMEISYAQKDCKNRDWSKELGEGFPFEIQDKDGTNRIMLKRSDHKEQIEVEVFLPSPVNEAEENSEQEGQSEDGKHRSNTGNSVPAQYCIPLIVRIRKAAASYLKISCSSYPNELIIESLSFEPNNEYGGLASHEAKLSNLPEEFQKALYFYLRSRGISTDITDFLHAYVINKECHDYLSWLRKRKGLIKN